MTNDRKIKTIIIDNNDYAFVNIRQCLADIQEIEIVGTSTNYKHAKKLLTETTFDLLIVSAEISGKLTFDLIQEIRTLKNNEFGVIINFDDDRHVIRALRESAIDYIVKPLNSYKLKTSLDLYLAKKENVQNNSPRFSFPNSILSSEIVSLPTHLGLRFVEKKRIALFTCTKDLMGKKPYWAAVLSNFNSIKLKSGINAKAILDFIGQDQFLQINQSTLVNIRFVSHIEFCTRICFLLPPFEQSNFIISKTHFSEIKAQLDRL